MRRGRLSNSTQSPLFFHFWRWADQVFLFWFVARLAPLAFGLWPTFANPILTSPLLASPIGQPILANPFLCCVVVVWVCCLGVLFGRVVLVVLCWLCCVGCVVLVVLCWLCCVVVGVLCGWCWCGCWFCTFRTPLRRTPLRRTPLCRTPPPDRPKFRSFFPSPAPLSFSLSLSGCLLVEFWLFFSKAGVSGLRYQIGLSLCTRFLSASSVVSWCLCLPLVMCCDPIRLCSQ